MTENTENYQSFTSNIRTGKKLTHLLGYICFEVIYFYIRQEWRRNFLEVFSQFNINNVRQQSYKKNSTTIFLACFSDLAGMMREPMAKAGCYF